MTPAQSGRHPARNMGDAVDAQQLATHRLSITASSRRTAQDDGCGRPLAEALRVALRVERRLMLGQYEGIVDSEGAELLAVGQEEAEVLPRQGHQLQRYRDAGLGHVVLQCAGRQLEGRAGATLEEQVAWRKSRVVPAPVARGERRKEGTLRILAAPLDNQDGVAEGDRLHRDASRVKNELVAAYSWDDRAVAKGLGARASIGELADGDGFGLGGCLRNGQERQQNRETCQNFHLDHSLQGGGKVFVMIG
jgi:hypothetical protein